jgi:hypothetical protein
MSREDGNCQSQGMPTQIKQVVSSFLTWFAYEKLTMSMTWQITLLPIQSTLHTSFSTYARGLTEYSLLSPFPLNQHSINNKIEIFC